MKTTTERLKFVDEYPKEAGKLAQRLHIKKDEIPFVRKFYTYDKSEGDVSKKDRTLISRISCVSPDREGDVLLPQGAQLENYKNNPIVCWTHSYGSPEHFIGKNLWIKQDENGLIAKTAFAKTDFADQVFRAYTEDVAGTGPLLKGFSVGFIPLEVKEPEKKEKGNRAKRIFSSWELLEYSCVGIPCSPESVTLAHAKGIIGDGLKKNLETGIETKPAPELTIGDLTDGLAMAEEEVEAEAIPTITHPVAKEEDRPESKITTDANGDEYMVITKPETTDQYHRIPVSEGHGKHKIRTTTVSAKKGIKALYCVDCKKIITYLFDVDKFSMEEAQAWVDSHKSLLGRYETKLAGKEGETKALVYKERWNKSLSKIFDVESAEAPEPPRFMYSLFEKFLDCKIKHIFQNGYIIPSPLLGTYLAGFKHVLSEYKLKDTRNFDWSGRELPPTFEVIHLNSKESDDFLIDGMNFYDANGMPLVIRFVPDWYGVKVYLTTSSDQKEWNKGLLDTVHLWVKENSYLRGEKFSLSGEFLPESDDSWDNLILEKKYKDAISKTTSFLEKKSTDFVGRGLLFIGPPGTGKTKTGRTLINSLDTTFIWVSSRDFKHIGPLQALSLSFSLARDLAPSVLFIEDVDTWLQDMYGDSVVVDLLKTEMDGILQNKGMVTILTSNYPEKLPDALLDRPGRFHHIVNFALPDQKHREEMIKLWTEDIEKKLLAEIVNKTEGFSGAHLKELVAFASMIAEEEEISIGKALLKSLERLLEQRELIEEIRGNKTGTKSVWDTFKWIDGDIQGKEIAGIEDDEVVDEEETQGFIKDIMDGLGELKEESVLELEEKAEFTDEEIQDIIDKREEPILILDGDEEEEDVLEIDSRGFGRLAEGYKANAELHLEIAHEFDGTTHFNAIMKEIREELDTLKEERETTETRRAELEDIEIIIKEGRILSAKNRTLVKDVLDSLGELRERLEDLYNATEPPGKEEVETGHVIEIEPTKEKKIIEIEEDEEKEDTAITIDPKQLSDMLDAAVTKVMTPERVASAIKEGHELAYKKLRGDVE